MIHADPGYPIAIADGCTVGHRAMLHGCRIGENCLIGMGAIVMNGAVIAKNSIVGAGALITERKTFPEGSLIVGNPARAIRKLSNEEMAGNRAAAIHYLENGRRFQTGLI